MRSKRPDIDNHDFLANIRDNELHLKHDRTKCESQLIKESINNNQDICFKSANCKQHRPAPV